MFVFGERAGIFAWRIRGAANICIICVNARVDAYKMGGRADIPFVPRIAYSNFRVDRVNNSNGGY